MCWAWWYLRAPPQSRKGVQTCLCLPFRNHHFSKIDSTSHSMAGRVHCLYRGVGGRGVVLVGVCVDSCTKASPSSWGEWLHAASDTLLLTCSEMQFLRRTSGWMLSSSGGCSCRQHTDEANELVQLSGTFFLPHKPAMRRVKICSQCSLHEILLMPFFLNRPTPLWLYWRLSTQIDSCCRWEYISCFSGWLAV